MEKKIIIGNVYELCAQYDALRSFEKYVDDLCNVEYDPDSIACNGQVVNFIEYEVNDTLFILCDADAFILSTFSDYLEEFFKNKENWTVIDTVNNWDWNSDFYEPYDDKYRIAVRYGEGYIYTIYQRN